MTRTDEVCDISFYSISLSEDYRPNPCRWLESPKYLPLVRLSRIMDLDLLNNKRSPIATLSCLDEPLFRLFPWACPEKSKASSQ